MPHGNYQICALKPAAIMTVQTTMYWW